MPLGASSATKGRPDVDSERVAHRHSRRCQERREHPRRAVPAAVDHRARRRHRLLPARKAAEGGEDVTGAHPAGSPAMTVPSAVDPDSRPVESPPPRVDRGPGTTGRPAPRWWNLSLPGSWGALLLVRASLTPSLLPRSGVAQGVDRKSVV